MKWILESSKSKLTCVQLTCFPENKNKQTLLRWMLMPDNLLWNLNSCSIIA
jgi:hypothetical protein